MLRRCAARLNFFPMGRRTGPLNPSTRPHALQPHKDLPPAGTDRSVGPQLRHRMQLHCPHCSFVWHYDTLTVHCPAEPAHNQREAWLHATWMWNKQQPVDYWRNMPLYKCPRTGRMLARESAKSMNNEKRGQGLTTRNLHRAKEQRTLAAQVSGIGAFSKSWRTHYPYPG